VNRKVLGKRQNIISLLRGAVILALFLSLGTYVSGADRTGGITDTLIQNLIKHKLQGSEKALADIVAGKSVEEVALNRDKYNAHNHLFNYIIKTGTITNQKGSGRCWMFASFNVLRPAMIKNYNLKDFEFSENYLLFWDKLEKSNFFLQEMIDMADRPREDRELEVLLDITLGDGGWWTYFADLVDKYGLVPKEIMPETYNSSSTGMMNKMLGLKLKQMGLELRTMGRNHTGKKMLESRKEEMLTELFRLLVYHLGTPPTEFTWRYETNDSGRIAVYPEKLTPQTFFRKVVNQDLHDYIALFNYPGKDYYCNYSLKFSRNMYDRHDLTIVNLPVDSLKVYALKSVLDSTPVWFACDVGQEDYSAGGILALDIYDYSLVYGTKFDLPKGDLIESGLITPNHAMVFIGVDTVSSKPQKWLVENSWGSDRGDKGLWAMYDDWFDRYMFGVIINKKYLSPQLLEMSQQKPIELPPWDPMYPINNLD